MDVHIPPARPDERFTDDGKRVREVVSYARRGSRFTAKQQRAWDARSADWVIPDDEALQGLDLDRWFGRSAPLIIEIGSGIGEATTELAAARPDMNVLAFEVWRPGVAETLGRADELELANVRLVSIDAAWAFRNVIAADSIAELWTFYPDPWHKKKHHKRRLITDEFAALAASRLEVGAAWRLATDWADYADQIASVLDACPALEGGVTDRWVDRPSTRFERRGLAANRDLHDFTYRRVG
ncbi:MAG TPA: tRNA (guanosine(46)-N7)-methyltransferase TrmB [Marmoricola sp.]|nr:tRNA (guanosine(46)-N7)-methyltransferase TrmB [Marmoricola sp.]